MPPAIAAGADAAQRHRLQAACRRRTGPRTGRGSRANSSGGGPRLLRRSAPSARGSGSPSTSFTSAPSRIADAAEVIAVAERGARYSRMTRLEMRVGDRAFQPVADFDARLAVVLGDQQQQAVVGLLAAELVLLGDRQRVLLDRPVAGARRPSAPPPGCPCAFRARPGRLELGDLRRAERAGQVGDVLRAAPARPLAAARSHARSERRAERQQRRGAAARRASSTQFCDGRRAFGGRWRPAERPAPRAARPGRTRTVGGFEIAASFSTEKFGLTS